MNFTETAQANLRKIESMINSGNRSRDKAWLIIIYILISAASIYFIYCFTKTFWFRQSPKVFYIIGVAGALSWLVKITHILRIIIYRKLMVPHILSRPDDPLQCIREFYVVVPTYKEKEWITYAVFRSISIETAKVDFPVTIIVNTPDETDVQNIRETLAEYPLKENVKLVTLSQVGKGKRSALAESLKYIKTQAHFENSAVALMDGDCIWGNDLLANVFPFFNKNPRLGGITTNEELICFGSLFYEKWFDYRLAFRDFYMCSHSFGKRTLCLTGRFAVIRSEIALRDDFIWIVENDCMEHWLWGHIKFLGGDDKSTWFWIYKNGYQVNKDELLYLPKALVYTLECINGENGFMRSQKNLKRWFTNTARNNTRSLMVTPVKQAPFFIWLCILMQRITMYSNFLGITTALVLCIQTDIMYLPAFLYLCILQALLATIIFSINRKRFLYWGIYIQIVNQWIGTFVKMWAFSHIAQQKWVHRGGQKTGVKGKNLMNHIKSFYAQYEFFLKIFFIVVWVLFMTKVINPVRDIEVFFWK